MAGVTSNPYANNRHADVLNEEPKDDDAKMRLVNEIKNRAKGAFAQKDMPSAELLYGKAITVLDTMPGKQEATLYSNRAMVRLNLNKVEGALEDANKCIELEPANVKAWHRKAQALSRLNEWDDAIAAAQEGAKLDPANKAFQEIIEKAEKDKEKDKEDKAKLKRDAQDVRVELHNASTARAPPQKKDKKEGEDDVDMNMRGYKTTSDGKTTSYFHTEISEEAKKLIAAQGFGKPQKIEAAVETADVKGGGSQWNKAGTYEEKGMKKWVEERLSDVIKGIEFKIPVGDGGSIVVKEVSDLQGDASISVSRGKRRHLLDISFNVQFEAKVGTDVGQGKLAFSEVTTTDDSNEVKLEINADTPPSVREVLNTFAKSGGQGLQPLIQKGLQSIIEEYKTK